MGLDGYVGGFEAQQRARRLQEERDERVKELEMRKSSSGVVVPGAPPTTAGGYNNRSSLVGFRGSSTVEEEKAFANQSVGLLTREEYAEKQEKVRATLDAERKRKEDVKREKREREKKKEKERKKKEKNLLSFNDDGEEDGEEEDQEEEKKTKKKKCVGMNPDADKSHVPNAQNEVVKEERLLR
jgi:protein FAM50